MLKEYQTKTNVGVGLGIASQLVGAYFMEAEDGNDVMAVRPRHARRSRQLPEPA